MSQLFLRILVGMEETWIDPAIEQNQFFAAIDYTNTSVLETGAAGLFGLGFPISRCILNVVASLHMFD